MEFCKEAKVRSHIRQDGLIVLTERLYRQLIPYRLILGHAFNRRYIGL
jgi:hypothetical protein